MTQPDSLSPDSVTTADGVTDGSTGRDKLCLLVLGMHRSGTSALTRVMNLLGYDLPDALIGALDGNEAGHWEPRNIVLYNDRLLSDMQSVWHDFRALPVSRLGPAELKKADTQIAELIGREYHGADRIILKDLRICRFAPTYLDALEAGGYRVVSVISYRNPAEVVRSLQKRRVNWPEGFGASQAALLWLRHVLDAELATRGLPRVFSAYGKFMADWRAEIDRMATQGGFDFPVPVDEAGPLIDEFLRADLHHERESAKDLAGQPALRGWCHRAHDALGLLSVSPDSASAIAMMDRLRAEFDAAELPLADLSDSSAATIRETRQHLAAVEETSAERMRMLEAGNAEIASLTGQIDQRNARLADQQQQIATLDDTLRETRDSLTARDHDLAAARRDLDEKERQTTDLAAARAALAGLVDEQDARIAELDAQLIATREENAPRIAAQQQEIAWQAAKIAELNQLFHNRNVQIDRMKLLDQQKEAEFRSSRSWRVTAPLRVGGRALRSMRDAGRSFKKASAAKGGMVAGTGTALRILFKEGPQGLRARLHDTQDDVRPLNLIPAHLDPSACFIAATPHVMSIAQMMGRILRDEGYSVTIRTDLVGSEHAGHVFVICPQMFPDLPDHYIAVQMEQSVSSRWFTPEYFAALNSARAVIDYSITNLSFLRENEVPLYKLHYVPLDCDRTLVSEPDEPRSGILFYGDDKCPRRQRILAAVRDAYPDLRIVNNLFGADLERELRRAAVVLNVHYYENALLETTRVYQALSYGTPVVSEMSSDQGEHDVLGGIVDFAPVDDVTRIIELLRPYADAAPEAAERRAAIAAFAARPDNRFEMFFRRFLLSQQMIGYDAFTLRAPDYPMLPEAPVRLCLSLPETPERRDQFLSQAKGGFQVWNGLKATPGWVGAALSYRHMFEKITESGLERAIVCEDDVLFPSDFNRRMDIVERYLKRRDWDVFSGFIADAHNDLTIVDVEEFEGETFVHVDRTVSMVFNIYNRKVMKFLAKWDPSDRNVETNTIDRYLENKGGMRVILTLPFLVGHRPDAQSTIWGFDNTQYDDVVEQSQKRLTEKLAEFRGRQKATL